MSDEPRKDLRTGTGVLPLAGYREALQLPPTGPADGVASNYFLSTGRYPAKCRHCGKNPYGQ